MRAVLTALLLTATQASAQAHPPAEGTGDAYAMTVTATGALLSYLNASPPSSVGGSQTLEAGGITVRVREETSSGPETIFIMPQEGCFAYPEEAEVEDGSGIDIEIICDMAPVS